MIDETQGLLVVRAALLQTVNTPGWGYIKQLTIKIQAKAIQDSLDEDDPALGESKRLKAKALQAGFNDLFIEIERLMSFGADDEQGQFTDLDPFGKQELEHGR